MNNKRLMEIDDTDLIAIEEVKKITKESFRIKESDFVIKWLKSNILRLHILLTFAIIIVKIVFDNIPIIFGLLGIYFILIFILLIDNKIEFNYYIEFYFKELEKRNIKITDKDIFKGFLNRYLTYKVFNICENLNKQSAYYFQKTKTNYLTEKELFISVVIFPKKYDLEEEPPRGASY